MGRIVSSVPMWYDVFSLFYDGALEKLYRAPRAEAVAALRLPPGSLVIDVACGTGQNFPPLKAHLGDGAIVGVDLSKGMLRRAERRAQKAGWTNVHLVQSSIHEFGASHLETHGNRATADGVLCALALTVIPDWETAFQRCFDLLRSGGRFAIFDVFAEKRTFQTWSTELVSGGDTSRQVWKPLQAAVNDFEMTYLPGSPRVFGGRLYVATGTKR